MSSLLSTAVVVGSFVLAPEAFALALTDFALFSLNDQIGIDDDGQKAPLGSLAEGDLVRLQVDEMKIQLKNEQPLRHPR